MANGGSYTPCALTQGTKRITAWIPSRSAILGAFVEVFDGHARRQRDLWTVSTVWSAVKDGASLREDETLKPAGFVPAQRIR